MNRRFRPGAATPFTQVSHRLDDFVQAGPLLFGGFQVGRHGLQFEFQLARLGRVVRAQPAVVHGLLLLVELGDVALQGLHLLAEFLFAADGRAGDLDAGRGGTRPGQLAPGRGRLALAGLDLGVDLLDVGLVLAGVVDHPAVADLDDARATRFVKCRSWLVKMTVPW